MTEHPTAYLRWTLDRVLEQRWEIKDGRQHTICLVWRPVPVPTYNGLVLYGPAYAE